MAGSRDNKGISRRGLLVGGGAAVGLVVAWQLWPRTYEPNLRAGEGETLFNAFLKIGIDGRVIVAVPQAEIGQGVYTSLPQILADELGADWRTVGVEPAPLSPLYANQLLAHEIAGNPLPAFLEGAGQWAVRESATRDAFTITGGSTSVRAFEPRLRQAGAAARALLQMAAAARWGGDWQELDTRGGFVVRAGGGEGLRFAELAADAAGLDLPEHLPVRGGLENRLAGQPLPRIDTPAKVDGSARFAADIRLPDMLFASVRSGPRGSTLLALDQEAARRVAGAVRTFRNPHWVAAVATTTWAAEQALLAMQPRWNVPRSLATSAGIDRALASALESGEPVSIFAAGDIEAEMAAPDVIRATYSVGPAPSAPLETLCATARVIGDLMEIWAPTQAPGFARAAAARASGFPEEQITIHQTLIGSGYGRKLETEAIEQAAIIALRLGRPVQLSWPRVEDIQKDYPRPPSRATLAARFGNGGTIAAWHARIAAPDTTAQVVERLHAGRLLTPSAGADIAGAVPPYDIPLQSIERVHADIGLETGQWRGGAHSATCFFTECFIDELARRANIEPLSFRMQMLGANPRFARVLSEAAAMGGWDGGPRGSGIGLAGHSAYGSHVATLVEIEVTADQRIRVLRAVAALDCGRVINPDLVKQQIEGGIIHGIAGATGTPLTYEHGAPTATTLADLGLPVLANAPEVTVEIIPSEEEPGGVTELAVPPVGPAIANAYFSLTGRRVRSLPLIVGAAS
jgi:isoquinoline 1-oxidoreductase beta subunit